MWEMLKLAWTGAKLRCPNCSKGRVWNGLFRLNPSCSECGVRFEPEEGDFMGAMVVAYSITSVMVVIGIFFVIWLTDLTFQQHLILWTAFTAIFLTLTYRNMKGIWIGILHWMVPLTSHKRSNKG